MCLKLSTINVLLCFIVHFETKTKREQANDTFMKARIETKQFLKNKISESILN